jgi:hypothetical protein
LRYTALDPVQPRSPHQTRNPSAQQPLPLPLSGGGRRPRAAKEKVRGRGWAPAWGVQLALHSSGPWATSQPPPDTQPERAAAAAPPVIRGGRRPRAAKEKVRGRGWGACEPRPQGPAYAALARALRVVMVEGTASGLLRCCCAWRCKHTHDEPACERPWPASQYSCRTRSSWTRLAGRLADCCSLIRRLHGLNSLVLITRHQHAYETTPDQAIACPHNIYIIHTTNPSRTSL